MGEAADDLREQEENDAAQISLHAVGRCESDRCPICVAESCICPDCVEARRGEGE